MIVDMLGQWDTRDVYADIIFNHAVSKHHLSERDRALTQEIFFGVLRWRGKLDWILQQLFVGKWEKSPRSVKNILFVGLYQLMFLDRIPAYAVINEAVTEAKQRIGKYWSGKINAILRNWVNGKSRVIFPDLAESPVDAVAVQYSHPRWLVQRWIKRWGVEQTVKLCQANNERPGVSLRVNCLKKTPTELYNLLANIEVEIKPSNDNPRFFQSDQISGLAELEAFQKGYFSIQDESAGLPCQLLNPQPGEVVVDLCSAPGGKTTYLAELTENRSTIVSVDKNYNRLLLLRENLHRLKLNAGRLVCCDGRHFSAQKVDKVLVDAPCSGLGVLSKRADLRWKRSESTIKQLAELQLALLENAARLLHPCGVIVYSTCTIEPDENEKIVQQFLERHPDYNVESANKFVSEKFVNQQGYVYTYPHRHQMDGSFAARLKKNNNLLNNQSSGLKT